MTDLAVAAHGFAHGRGYCQRRALLRMAIHNANQALATYQTVVNPTLPDLDVTDPEALVEAFINNGGNWQALVASVSRHQLDGATRNMGKKSHE